MESNGTAGLRTSCEMVLLVLIVVCVFGGLWWNVYAQLMGLFSRAQTFVSTQQLESVHWISENRFVSSHNDGSYAFWSPGSDAVPEPTTLYGPFPCKAVTKILVYPTAE